MRGWFVDVQWLCSGCLVFVLRLLGGCVGGCFVVV